MKKITYILVYESIKVIIILHAPTLDMFQFHHTAVLPQVLHGVKAA